MNDNRNVSILRLQNLHYKYPDGTHALQGIDMEIKSGEVVAILGANGAGKSTLLHHLNGIIRPTSGCVIYKDKPLEYSRRALFKIRQAVGIVFQDPDNQLFSASVYQDVSFGAVNLKLPEAEVHCRVEEALERTGISHLRDKPTHALSFGQKKRVAIAGVLVMKPQILVLDEPTAGLDPKGVTEIMQFLTEAQRKMGLTIIISTHDIDIVPIYCNRVFVMNEGRVVLEGPPQKVFAQKAILRSVNLRLPRIGHLMEILKEKDGLDIDGLSVTISGARKDLKKLREGF